MADVFVSYARADLDRIAPLIELIERQGWSVFWDRRLVPGDQWREHLLDELQACTACVVVWSTASVASEWVVEETALAKARKILVPAKLDAVEIPLGFRSVQAADVSDWTPGDVSHEQANSIISRLRVLIEQVEPAPPISTILSRAGYAFDFRSIQAASDQVSPRELAGRYDYSYPSDSDASKSVPVDADGAVWVDFVADMGGKFEPGFTLAHLIGMEGLELDGSGRLPRAGILITSDGLELADTDRFDYEWAMRRKFGSSGESDTASHKLFAIPGPYRNPLDGEIAGHWRKVAREFLRIPVGQSVLAGFDALFCAARQAQAEIIGPWHCPQHRSYWAIRLPHNWLLWGLDAPLGSPIDDAQLNYFERVADRTSPADTVILYLPAPPWLADPQIKNVGGTLWKIISVAQKNGARVGALIAGGAHYYSRYFSEGLNWHCITSGGASGALQPVHHLRNKLNVTWEGASQALKLRVRGDGDKQGRRPACWPSKTTGFVRSLATLAFPVTNFAVAVRLGVLYWVMLWLFATTRLGLGPWENWSVGDILRHPEFEWSQLFFVATQAAATNISLGIALLLFWVVLFGYADPVLGRARAGVATLHWLAHLAMMVLAYLVISWSSIAFVSWFWPRALPVLRNLDIDATATVAEIFRTIVIFPIGMVFIGGLAAAFIWGVYLFLTGSLLRAHTAEGFEALKIYDYKTFLRMRVAEEQAAIYPIGVKRVLRSNEWHETAALPDGMVRIEPTRAVKPRLLEGPIIIRKVAGN